LHTHKTAVQIDRYFHYKAAYDIRHPQDDRLQIRHTETPCKIGTMKFKFSLVVMHEEALTVDTMTVNCFEVCGK